MYTLLLWKIKHYLRDIHREFSVLDELTKVINLALGQVLESTPFNPPQTREGEDQIYATFPLRLCDLLAHLVLILRTSVRISNIYPVTY